MLVTPCIPSRQRAIRHFVLTNKVQTKHTTLQVGTLVLAWRGVQRVQVCLNGRSCAAVDACISPCHDVTIQNPQIALVNIKSVVLQLRQPGGALLSFSAMHCTLYASSTPAGVSNAMVRESHVMLNASCVHTRILWPGMRVLRVRPHVKDPRGHSFAAGGLQARRVKVFTWPFRTKLNLPVTPRGLILVCPCLRLSRFGSSFELAFRTRVRLR